MINYIQNVKDSFFSTVSMSGAHKNSETAYTDLLSIKRSLLRMISVLLEGDNLIKMTKCQANMNIQFWKFDTLNGYLSKFKEPLVKIFSKETLSRETRRARRIELKDCKLGIYCSNLSNSDCSRLILVSVYVYL